MQLPTKDNCAVLVKSLPLICLCGLVGILPDIDHVVAYFMGIPTGSDVRVWHPTIFLIVGVAILCLGSLSSGLYLRTVLSKRGKLDKV